MNKKICDYHEWKDIFTELECCLLLACMFCSTLLLSQQENTEKARMSSFEHIRREAQMSQKKLNKTQSPLQNTQMNSLGLRWI